jgi:uncharacterized Zn finger protein (UPF0148 family)
MRRCPWCDSALAEPVHRNRVFCDDCKRQKARAYRRNQWARYKQEKPKVLKAKAAEWYQENRQNNPEWQEKNKRRARAWRKKHRLWIRLYKQQYREAHG